MNKFSQTLLNSLEEELKKQVARLDEAHTQLYYEMLTYHMGWTGKGAGSKARGKRLRPLMLLLSTAAVGGNYQSALPAAAAVELIHNFSLLHDDIQDNSPTRRGRATVWTIWGVPQAINAGDGMFVLANMAMGDLAETQTAEITLESGRVLQNASLNLTRGQHLDIDYETREKVDVADYWKMIAGKTATLISASMEIGALCGGADADLRFAYRDFGHYLGLAFQVQDDILGIWGDEALTGKSAASDLIERKKSLPVLLGLEKEGEFAKRWAKGNIRRTEDVPKLAEMLEREGARHKAQEAADRMTDLALDALRIANPQGEAGEILYALAQGLLNREA